MNTRMHAHWISLLSDFMNIMHFLLSPVSEIPHVDLNTPWLLNMAPSLHFWIPTLTCRWHSCAFMTPGTLLLGKTAPGTATQDQSVLSRNRQRAGASKVSYLTFIRDISAEVDSQHRAATSWTSHVQRGGIFQTVIPKKWSYPPVRKLNSMYSLNTNHREDFLLFSSLQVFFSSILCVEMLVQSKCE